ncbi:MAG: DUF5112 domain-containing protein [Bacteroidaceae bacterium]|nr:DUF5112 domain-containing protein [Bacteroidaceae bacterium]
MKRIASLIAVFFALVACSPHGEEQRMEIDKCNERSYHDRYINIDSTLFYATRAEELTSKGRYGWYEAQINRAYVDYQRMDFDAALERLAQVTRSSRNQFHQLSAHVLYMKIAQRVGDGETFFHHRSRAQKILARIGENHEEPGEHYAQMVTYAQSELHIVSSTYYYYLGLDSAAVREINEAYDYVRDRHDTAQWINYNYMLGSGGLILGAPEDVVMREFDHLFLTYTLATNRGYRYFEANALQSLAVLLSDSTRSADIALQRAASCSFLSTQFACEDYGDSLCFAMARRAVTLFEEYKDLYQTACAYRTMGELYFAHADYLDALEAFQHALSLVENQRKRSRQTVNPWIAGIREKLSMTYSALGDKMRSDQNRNIYLDLLDQYRQNYESENRLRELKHEVASIRVKTAVLFGLIVLTLLLAYVFVRRMNRRAQQSAQRLTDFRASAHFQTLTSEVADVRKQLAEDTEYYRDTLQVSRMHIERYKAGNVERRAKVSLVYSIIPYLDRMLAEVRKMVDSGRPDEERLQYVGELAEEIMHINDALTDWIKMTQGQLTLHVTTFSLQEIIDVIALSRPTFEQKHLTLQLPVTDVQVKADKALTLFMINTLADNARKFTPEHGMVSIGVERAEDYVEISVSDTGVGLSEHDCSVLNDSKVYDASSIGASASSKGFGFGIMNCKGIIQKYRKTSQRFAVCQFGVSSTLGQGSRFWFRLPKALSVLLALLCLSVAPSKSFAKSNPFEAMYDSIYAANVEGRHAQSLEMGIEFVRHLQPPYDTAYVVLIHNEIAVAALAMGDWPTYRRNNDECVRLHKLFTQDKSIEAYCERMQELQSNGIQVYVMLIIVSLIALVLFYLLYLRKGLRSDRLYSQLFTAVTSYIESARNHVAQYGDTSPAHLQQTVEADDFIVATEACRSSIASSGIGNHTMTRSANLVIDEVETLYQTIQHDVQQFLTLDEQCHKVSFEEDRLYVMNQIMDNCLSTIKHETMYYPARAKQLVDNMHDSEAPMGQMHELLDLLQYYREVYMLLYHQADRQVEQYSFRRQTLSAREALETFVSELTESVRRQQKRDITLRLVADEALRVVADKELLQTLLHALVADGLPNVESVSILAQAQPTDVLFRITFHGITKSDEEIERMFSPDSPSVHCLIARQIIKEHDAHCGMPGLRLHAEGGDADYSIVFTLKRA